MADNPPSISESESEVDFIELAVEMVLLERGNRDHEGYGTAESVLREAVEFRKSLDFDR